MTLPEIEVTFQSELCALVEANKSSYEDIIEKITCRYDGYHFDFRGGVTPYNPLSVLNALSKQVFYDYWFAFGTPTFLAGTLRKTNYDIRELDGIEVSEASLLDDRASINNPVPMIYQSGYLTIKGCDECLRLHMLGYLNEEVKYGFLNSVASVYAHLPETETPLYIGKFIQELENGNIEAFLTRLKAFFADISYELSDRAERHYQVVFYIIFKLLGQFTEAEVRSAQGCADAIVKAPRYIYVFGSKLRGTAEEAIRQIDDRDHLIPYTADEREVIKVGVAFDVATRNLGEWPIEKTL